MRVWHRATPQPLTSLDVFSSEKRGTQLVSSCFFVPVHTKTLSQTNGNNKILFPAVALDKCAISANNLHT